MPSVYIQRLANVPLPHYEHADDAGLDLPTRTDITLNPGAQRSVPTGIAMAIPPGYAGLVWDKSGNGIKRGLKTFGGVIDAGYRGEIHIGIKNCSDTPVSFAAGDHIAQMLIQPVAHAHITEVDELDSTERGQHGGFKKEV